MIHPSDSGVLLPTQVETQYLPGLHLWSGSEETLKGEGTEGGGVLTGTGVEGGLDHRGEGGG